MDHQSLKISVIFYVLNLAASLAETIPQTPRTNVSISNGTDLGRTTEATPVKCGFLEKLCPDGQCHAAFRSCPRDCNSFEKSCADGSCMWKFETCPGSCDHLRPKLCADGTCTMVFLSCVEPGCTNDKPKKCPGGACIGAFSSCLDVCPVGKKRCLSGACLEPHKLCMEGCGSMLMCYRGDGCYSDHERCNGISECADSSDEKDCGLDSSGEEQGWPGFTILLILGAFAMVGFCVAYYCQRLVPKSHEESGSTLQAQILSEGSSPEPVTAGVLPGSDSGHREPPTNTTLVDLPFLSELPPLTPPPPSYNEAVPSDFSPYGAEASLYKKQKPPSYEAVIADMAPSAPPIYSAKDSASFV